VSTIRAVLRSVVLSPALAEVSYTRRGFPSTLSVATDRLERIPQSVTCGGLTCFHAQADWRSEAR